MNRLEIANRYQNMPIKDFLLWLSQIREIIKNRVILQFIKEIMHEIKRHQQYSFISQVKGLLSNKGGTVAPDYYDYTKSKNLQEQLRVLWRALDMDERYFSKSIQEEYQVLKGLYSAEELQGLSLDKEGNFVIKAEDNTMTVRVFTSEEYDKFKDFLLHNEEYRYQHKNGELVEITPENFVVRKNKLGNYVVNMSEPAAKQFVGQVLLEQIKTQKQEPVVEINSNSHEDDIHAILGPDTSDWKKLDLSESRTIKKKLKSISLKDADKLANVQIRCSAAKELILKRDVNGYAVIRIPFGFQKNDSFVITGNSQFKGQYFKIPMDRLHFINNGNALIKQISMNEQFEICDKEGNPIKDAEGKNIEIPALTVAEHFNISQIRVLEQEEQKRTGIVVDGREMEQLETSDGYTYAISRSGTPEAVILGYRGTETEISIPSQLKIDGIEYPVIEIKDSAFQGCVATQITVPSTVKEIRNLAFADSKSLKQITLSEGIASIGDYAFKNTALEAIDLPSTVENLGKNIVIDCNKLSEIHVDTANKVYREEKGVLFRDKELYSYPLGSDAKVYSIPEGVETISDSAFKGCRLEQVHLPETLTTIQDSAFLDSAELKMVTVEDALSDIGADAFANCTSLEAFDLSHTRNIGKQAFMNTPLVEIELNHVENVCESAFQNNMKLKNVVVNSEHAKINISAFNNCPLKNEIRGIMADTEKIQIPNPELEIQRQNKKINLDIEQER